jgi:hypothetical protein
MDESPELFVTPQNDISSPASISPIGPAFSNLFIAVKVNRTCSALTGAATYFYIIYKVRISHSILVKSIELRAQNKYFSPLALSF